MQTQNLIEKQNHQNQAVFKTQYKNNPVQPFQLLKTPFNIANQCRQPNLSSLMKQAQNIQTQLQDFIIKQSQIFQHHQFDSYLLTNKSIFQNIQINKTLNKNSDASIMNLIQQLKTNQSHFNININFKLYPQLIQNLYSMTNSLIIIVTNYQLYFQKILSIHHQDIAYISSYNNLQLKSRILESYQMKKLKLLFISPEMFVHEDYHVFNCQLLLIIDYHLYDNQQKLKNQIKKQIHFNKILYCFPIINEMKNIDCRNRDLTRKNKQKNLINLINKSKYDKILVLVKSRIQANIISNLLSLKCYRTINLIQQMGKSLIENYKFPNLLQKQNKNQGELLKNIDKISKYTIVVSQYFDALKLIDFDLTINYNIQFVSNLIYQLELGKSNYIFLEDNDYVSIREQMSINMIDKGTIQKLTRRFLSKQTKKQGNKRYYSQTLDEIMLKKFSIDKEEYVCQDLKTIRMNKISKQNNIRKQELYRMIQILEQMKYGSIVKNVNLQGSINQYDFQRFKQIFKQQKLTQNKINFLNISNQMKITTKQFIQKLKYHKIKYIITQEILAFKIQKTYQTPIIQSIYSKLYSNTVSKFHQLDLTYTILKKCAFKNLQVAKNDKSHTKIDQFYQLILIYLKSNNFSYDNEDFQTPLNRLSKHEQNVLKNEIKEWMYDVEQQAKLSQHQIVLYLMGQLTRNTNRLDENSKLFKRYKKYKYEELLQIVKNMRCNKKVKMN